MCRWQGCGKEESLLVREKHRRNSHSVKEGGDRSLNFDRVGKPELTLDKASRDKWGLLGRKSSSHVRRTLKRMMVLQFDNSCLSLGIAFVFLVFFF